MTERNSRFERKISGDIPSGIRDLLGSSVGEIARSRGVTFVFCVLANFRPVFTEAVNRYMEPAQNEQFFALYHKISLLLSNS